MWIQSNNNISMLKIQFNLIGARVGLDVSKFYAMLS